MARNCSNSLRPPNNLWAIAKCRDTRAVQAGFLFLGPCFSDASLKYVSDEGLVAGAAACRRGTRTIPDHKAVACCRGSGSIYGNFFANSCPN